MTTIRRPNRRPIRGLSEMVNELCTASGKRRYLDGRSAIRAMAELVAGDPKAETLNAYRCPACSDFHVGHVPEVAS